MKDSLLLLLRSGRFDRKVIIDPPNIKERTAIFSLYLKKMKLANSFDIEEFHKKWQKLLLVLLELT